MTAVVDDFTRADSTGLGANWVITRGQMNVVSNQAQSTMAMAESRAMWATPMDSDDHGAEVRLVNGGTFGQRGPMVRANSTGTQGYCAARGSTSVALFRLSGTTTYTLVGSTVSQTWANNDVLRIEAEGSTIRVLVNGVVRITQTDTNYPTGRYVGIDKPHTVADSTFDDFAAADLGTPVPVNASMTGTPVVLTITAPAGTMTATGGAQPPVNVSMTPVDVDYGDGPYGDGPYGGSGVPILAITAPAGTMTATDGSGATVNVTMTGAPATLTVSAPAGTMTATTPAGATNVAMTGAPATLTITAPAGTMTATDPLAPDVDYATPLGQVRLLIADTDPASQILSDAMLMSLLALYTDNVKRAAAAALDVIARDRALVLQVIRAQDLSTDGAKLAAELRASAAQLRAEADAADDEDDCGISLVRTPELAERPVRWW